MALKRYEKYPNRWDPATPEQPQGAFKNRTTTVSKDGSFIEKAWANDWSGFFSAALVKANIVPNGEVDTALNSQYFQAFLQYFYNPENKPAPSAIGAADRVHGHVIGDVTGLQSALDGKATAAHKHNIADINSLQASLDSKLDKSGGTVTGDLTVSGKLGIKTSSFIVDGTNVIGTDANLVRVGDGNYSKTLNLAANGGVVTVTSSSGKTYKVYHEGNKPTAAEVGALGVNDKALGLRGHYVLGGNEKPSYFGKGVVKAQMLAGKNIGSPSYWNDCLWISSFDADDIKPSTLIAFGKSDPDFVGFSVQDHDADSWGTMNRIYHQGFKPTAADIGTYTKAESDARMIGIGQTWQNLTTSRKFNTTYRNTTGKAIQVFVLSKPYSGYSTLAIVVDGVTAAACAVNFTNGQVDVCAIIPDGAEYSVVNSSSGASLEKWSELL